MNISQHALISLNFSQTVLDETLFFNWNFLAEDEGARDLQNILDAQAALTKDLIVVAFQSVLHSWLSLIPSPLEDASAAS